MYAIIAEIMKEEGNFNVIGYGVCPSRGLSKGLIVDIEKVSADVETAIRAAEHMANVNVTRAFVGISGKHIESLMSHASREFDEIKEIDEEDKKELEKLAQSRVVPIERKVIHSIMYNYKIDDSGVLKNPIGMKGKRIEADAHIVTGVLSAIEALITAVQKAGIEVEDVLLEPYASAEAVLTDTEKKFGAVLVDIGGGTTDVAMYKNNKLIYTSVLPIGGTHYTNDIATVLNIPLKMADRLKKEFSLYIDETNLEEVIEITINNYGEKKEIELSYLKEIIDFRTEEIIENIKKKIDASGFKQYMLGGIVFTGGSSKIAGLKNAAEAYFDLPVRMGVPIGVGGVLDKVQRPEDSTGIGILLHAVEQYTSEEEFKSIEEEKVEDKKTTFDVLSNKIKNWFENLF